MAKPYNQIVLFGDSILQWSSAVQDGFSFQGALQSLCMRGLDVINRGFGGYNTKNALELLPQIFQPPSLTNPKIEYLIVLFGANDAALPLPTCTQGVPIDRYKDNLTKIITHDHIKAHKAKVLLVTPPPLDEIRKQVLDVEGGHARATRQAAVTAKYSEVVREIASETPGVVLIDLWKAIMEKAISMTPQYDPSGRLLGDPAGGRRGGLESLLPDGLHLSGESYKVFFGIVEPHIGPFPANFSVFPEWRELHPGSI